MSQDNVEVVREAIEAFNRGDWNAVLKHVATDAEVDLSGAVGPVHGVYRRDEWERFMPDYAENWRALRIEPEEFIEAGGYVIVPWTLYATGRDGIEVEARVTWTFTVREGILAGVRMYQERSEALRAAGLSE